MNGSSQHEPENPPDELQPDDAKASPKRGETWTVLPRLGFLLCFGASIFFVAVGSWQIGLGLFALCLPAICGGKWRIRTLQYGGVALMVLVGCLLMLVGASWYDSDSGGSLMFSGLGKSLGLLFVRIGLGLEGASFLLAFPWWHSQDS